MAARMIFFYHRALRLLSPLPHLWIALKTPRFTRRRGECIRWKLFRRPSVLLSSPKSLLSQQTANLRKSQSRSRWRPPRHPPSVPPFVPPPKSWQAVRSSHSPSSCSHSAFSADKEPRKFFLSPSFRNFCNCKIFLHLPSFRSASFCESPFCSVGGRNRSGLTVQTGDFFHKHYLLAPYCLSSSI